MEKGRKLNVGLSRERQFIVVHTLVHAVHSAGRERAIRVGLCQETACVVLGIDTCHKKYTMRLKKQLPHINVGIYHTGRLRANGNELTALAAPTNFFNTRWDTGHKTLFSHNEAAPAGSSGMHSEEAAQEAKARFVAKGLMAGVHISKAPPHGYIWRMPRFRNPVR